MRRGARADLANGCALSRSGGVVASQRDDLADDRIDAEADGQRTIDRSGKAATSEALPRQAHAASLTCPARSTPELPLARPRPAQAGSAKPHGSAPCRRASPLHQRAAAPPPGRRRDVRGHGRPAQAGRAAPGRRRPRGLEKNTLVRAFAETASRSSRGSWARFGGPAPARAHIHVPRPVVDREIDVVTLQDVERRRSIALVGVDDHGSLGRLYRQPVEDVDNEVTFGIDDDDDASGLVQGCRLSVWPPNPAAVPGVARTRPIRDSWRNATCADHPTAGRRRDVLRRAHAAAAAHRAPCRLAQRGRARAPARAAWRRSAPPRLG